MKCRALNAVLGMMLVVSLSGRFVGAAEEGIKALPTLLIKGEVVSLDTNDPSANLLTVKDRYGFETLIYLTQETKVTQADAAIDTSTLVAGTSVEVEYNFDVNTAKRHGVSIKVATASTAPAEAATTTSAALTAPDASMTPMVDAASSASTVQPAASEATSSAGELVPPEEAATATP